MGDRHLDPRTGKLIKLSELFGVTLDQLVRGEDAPETESVPASAAPRAAPERGKAPYHRRNSFTVYRRGHFGSLAAAHR